MRVALIERQHEKIGNWNIIAVCIDKKVAEKFVVIHEAMFTKHNYRYRLTDLVTNIDIIYCHRDLKFPNGSVV